MRPETGGLGLGVTPIGPTWDPEHYFLGADNQGRDVAARLLYGGRNSLLIGFFAALITCVLGTAIGLAAGFFGGLRRRRALARPGRRLGVSRLPARDLPLDRADHARGRLRPVQAGVREPPPADRDHRRRVRAVRRPPDPGRGPLASASRVRRGGDRAGRLEPAADREGHPAERRHDGDRLLPAGDGAGDADRGGAVVPLDRSPAAGRELGHDHPGRRRADLHAAGCRARARASRSP